MKLTRIATVRLVAAVFAVLIVAAMTVSAQAADDALDPATLLVALGILLALAAIGLLSMMLLDPYRRRQLSWAAHDLLQWARLVMRARRSGADADTDKARLAEKQRRLGEAAHGLWAAVRGGPGGAAVPVVGDKAAPVVRTQATADVGKSGHAPVPKRDTAAARDGVRRLRRATGLATAPLRVQSSARPTLVTPGLPVSSGVARGAPLVRISQTRHQQCLSLAAARTNLAGLRREDKVSEQRAAALRWIVRSVLLLSVPAVLVIRVTTGTSWLSEVWDGGVSRVGLLVALALGLSGGGWVLAVTRPRRGLSLGRAARSETHSVRSLFATEQLAIRLAAGSRPETAWSAAALANHFAPDAVIPAHAVGDALALVRHLRATARRRHRGSIRRRIKEIALPVVTCLLPAAVILVLL